MAFELNKKDYENLEENLLKFLEMSEASSAMLCDRGGSILLKEGEAFEHSADLIAALVSGAFAATKELALALGEDEFEAIFQQGHKNSIFITSVSEEVILLAIFSQETNAGLVKMYAQNTCVRLHSLFQDISTREFIVPDDETASFVIKKGNIF